MIDYIYLWTGERENAIPWAREAAQEIRRNFINYYLPRYWRECVDVEFERQFACFGTQEKAA